MIREIQYSGYATKPSDREAQDGQLAACINLINDDGYLAPLPQPDPVLQLQPGQRVLYVHTTSAFSHLIVQDDATHALSWIDKSRFGEGQFGLVPSSDKIGVVHKLSAVGNTLVALSDTGVHYILWKSDDGGYRYLGQQPPFVELQFATSAQEPGDYPHTWVDGSTNVHHPYYAWRQIDANPEKVFIASPGDGTRNGIRKKYQDEITEAAWALINQANAYVTEHGHFYAPFFVRYCYRLYDGTMYMHSAPVFIPVAMASAFQVEVHNLQGNVDGKKYFNKVRDYEAVIDGVTIDLGDYTTTLGYRPANVALTYRMTGEGLSELRADWSDIVKSIDIFVSEPILREDNGKPITAVAIAESSMLYRDRQFVAKSYPIAYRLTTGNHATLNFDSNVVLDIPKLSEEAYADKIGNIATFYKVGSMNIDDTSLTAGTWRTLVPYEVLPHLATQEAMTDDYKTHNTLLPAFDADGNCISSLFTYNNRLNVAGIREKLFAGFSLSALLPSTSNSLVTSISHVPVRSVYVFLHTDDGDKAVGMGYEGGQVVLGAFLQKMPLFYPDNRAYKMRVVYSYYGASQTFVADLPMRACPLLNGAFTEFGLLGDTSFSLGDDASLLMTVQNDIVNIQNKVYSSEVGNPFYFPVTGIHTVGTGNILGLCAATQALSQGQFGQFPLYAFCSDGVYALAVGGDGRFTACHPVSRDVCSNPGSITQTDQSVLFATDKGIMEIGGSTLMTLTTDVSDPLPPQLDQLPYLDKLHTLLGYSDSAFPPTVKFADYLKQSRIIYDYAHQHIILFNTEYRYAYVYSVRSKLWGMMYGRLRATVNAYPEIYALSEGNMLVSFANTNDYLHNGLFITRPITFGAPDVLKSVHEVMQRGVFREGGVSTVLYGSRDLYSWHLIDSSVNHRLHGIRGTGYKYFCIAGLTKLEENQSVSGASVEVTLQLTDKMR